MKLGDPFCREFERAPIQMGQRVERRGQLYRGDTQVRRGETDAVELARELDEGAIERAIEGSGRVLNTDQAAAVRAVAGSGLFSQPRSFVWRPAVTLRAASAACRSSSLNTPL